MKITNYIILFFIVCFGMIVVLDNSVLVMKTSNKLKLDYDRAIDSAIDDTVYEIVDSVDTTVTINLDEVKNKYFNSLNAGMGALDSPTQQETLRVYTPVLGVVDTDGLSILYHSIGDNAISLQWSPKFYYTYDGTWYTINYTLGDEFTLVLSGCNKVFTGTLGTVIPKDAEGNSLPEIEFMKYKYAVDVDGDGTVNADNQRFLDAWDSIPQLQSKEVFETYRRSTITNTIVENMNYYVNAHNDVAEKYGISYTFTLPESFADTAARAIDDISVLSIFQGYPIGGSTSERYSKYSLGGARINKNTGYYVAETADGIRYYHRYSCKLHWYTDENGNYVTSKEMYSTQKDSAEHGANPCPYCNP